MAKDFWKKSFRFPYPRDSEQVVLIVILTLGFGLRLWNVNWDLPEIYEEAYPLTISWKFWNWGHAGFNFNLTFFNYPALTFYIQFLVQAVHYVVGYLSGTYNDLQAFQKAYETNPTVFVVLARLVSLLFDMGAILVAYFFARRFADYRAGLLAALLVAINPLHIEQAHLVAVDTPLMFFALVSVFFIYELYTAPEKRWNLLCAICIGLAMATKYTGAILMLVLVTAYLLRSRSISEAIYSLKEPALISSLFLSGLLFIILNLQIIFSFKEFLGTWTAEQQHMLYGHLGLDPSQSTIGFYVTESLPLHLGLPLITAVVLAPIFSFMRKDKRDLLLWSFPLMYFSMIIMWEMRADRYILPIIPVLILIGSVALLRWWDTVRKFLRESPGRSRVQSNWFLAVAGLAAGLSVLFPSAVATLKYHQTHILPDTRTVAKERIYKDVPEGAAIALGPMGLQLDERKFRVLQLPFYPVYPNVVSPFYDARLYENVDFLIVSTFDYDRYNLEPRKYQKFIQFYETIKKQWQLWHEIRPVKNQTGPTIWLFQPPIGSNDFIDPELLERIKVAPQVWVDGFLAKLEMFAYDKGEFKKTEAIIRAAISRNPQNFLIYRDLAQVLYKLGNYEQGLKAVEIYLHSRPKDAEMIALRAMLLAGLHRLGKNY